MQGFSIHHLCRFPTYATSLKTAKLQSFILEKDDGINQGETYIYEFEINKRAGTYWYHVHTQRYRKTGLLGIGRSVDSQ